MVDPFEAATEGVPLVEYPSGGWIFGRSGSISLQIELNPFSLSILGLWRYGIKTGRTGHSTSSAPGIPRKRAAGYKIKITMTYKNKAYQKQFLLTNWLPVKIIAKLLSRYKKEIKVKGVRII